MGRARGEGLPQRARGVLGVRNSGYLVAVVVGFLGYRDPISHFEVGSRVKRGVLDTQVIAFRAFGFSRRGDLERFTGLVLFDLAVNLIGGSLCGSAIGGGCVGTLAFVGARRLIFALVLGRSHQAQAGE